MLHRPGDIEHQGHLDVARRERRLRGRRDVGRIGAEDPHEERGNGRVGGHRDGASLGVRGDAQRLEDGAHVAGREVRFEKFLDVRVAGWAGKGPRDRKSGVEGKRVSGRVDIGGRRIINITKTTVCTVTYYSKT